MPRLGRVRWGLLIPVSVMLVCALGAPEAGAHPFHVTLAEVEYNARSDSLEIAVRVSLHDLEDAMRRQGAPRPRTAAERDSLVFAYVGPRWLLVDAAADTQAVSWVGAEYGVPDAWLYLEAPMPGGLDGSVVGNRLFLELDPRQANTVNFRQVGKTFSVTFTRERPEARLRVPAQP